MNHFPVSNYETEQPDYPNDKKDAEKLEKNVCVKVPKLNEEEKQKKINSDSIKENFSLGGLGPNFNENWVQK